MTGLVNSNKQLEMYKVSISVCLLITCKD